MTAEKIIQSILHADNSLTIELESGASFTVNKTDLILSLHKANTARLVEYVHPNNKDRYPAKCPGGGCGTDWKPDKSRKGPQPLPPPPPNFLPLKPADKILEDTPSEGTK